jgi:exodeoxyribonuclease VII small subunit
MEKKKTYEEAFEELQNIVKEIENGTISVDVLGEKVKRAGELIRFCKEKLFKTEQEVNDVLKEIDTKTN